MLNKKKHIFIIGMMGSGKTTLASILSKTLKIPYIDTDQDLSSILGLEITEIFNSLSEKKFRMLESVYFLEHIKNNQHIYATGGGTILEQNNRSAMKKEGKTILLQTSPQELFNRLINDKKNQRPYFEENKNEQYLSELWSNRKKYYIECADYIVKTDKKEPFEIANEIIKNLK